MASLGAVRSGRAKGHPRWRTTRAASREPSDDDTISGLAEPSGQLSAKGRPWRFEYPSHDVTTPTSRLLAERPGETSPLPTYVRVLRPENPESARALAPQLDRCHPPAAGEPPGTAGRRGPARRGRAGVRAIGPDEIHRGLDRPAHLGRRFQGWTRLVGPHRRAHRGTLPCLRFGRSSCLVASMSRLRASTRRVSAGSMTSST